MSKINKTNWRIKTKKEFEKEFGNDWRKRVRYVWLSPNMDYLFGYSLTRAQANDILADRRGIDTWSISRDMLTK